MKGAFHETQMSLGVRPQLRTGRTRSRFPVIVLHRLFGTDRSLMMTAVVLPLILAGIAFILAVALTAFGAPTIGTMRSTIAGLAYVYLMLCVMWLPAYTIGCAWFWWATRDEDNLLKRLYTMPWISALFVWFPALYFTPVSLAEKARMYPMLAVTVIIASYVWVGLVRLMFHVWRQK